MDLSRAYQEVKSLPDEALTKELSQPSGMVPGYLVMAELEDRKALRAGGGGMENKTSMKDELLQGLGSVPGYSGGGLVAGVNPFYAQMQARMNPQYAATMMQEQMTNANGGYYPLNAPNAPGQPQAPQGLASMVPGPSAPPQRPGYAKGGLVSSNVIKDPKKIEVPTQTMPMPIPYGHQDTNHVQAAMSGYGVAADLYADRYGWDFFPSTTYKFSGKNGEEEAAGPVPEFEKNGGMSPGGMPLPLSDGPESVGHDPRAKARMFSSGIAGLGRR